MSRDVIIKATIKEETIVSRGNEWVTKDGSKHRVYISLTKVQSWCDYVDRYYPDEEIYETFFSNGDVRRNNIYYDFADGCWHGGWEGAYETCEAYCAWNEEALKAEIAAREEETEEEEEEDKDAIIAALKAEVEALKAAH